MVQAPQWRGEWVPEETNAEDQILTTPEVSEYPEQTHPGRGAGKGLGVEASDGCSGEEGADQHGRDRRRPNLCPTVLHSISPMQGTPGQNATEIPVDVTSKATQTKPGDPSVLTTPAPQVYSPVPVTDPPTACGTLTRPVCSPRLGPEGRDHPQARPVLQPPPQPLSEGSGGEDPVWGMSAHALHPVWTSWHRENDHTRRGYPAGRDAPCHAATMGILVRVVILPLVFYLFVKYNLWCLIWSSFKVQNAAASLSPAYALW